MILCNNLFHQYNMFLLSGLCYANRVRYKWCEGLETPGQKTSGSMTTVLIIGPHVHNASCARDE